jgi:hypothetical protein
MDNNLNRIALKCSTLCFIAALFFFHLLPLTAHAGLITLQTSVDVTVRDDKLTVVVTVINTGDEPAYHVAVHVEAGKETKSRDEQPVLQINKPGQSPCEFDISGLKPGIHPIIVRLDFTDANQYPFSSISVTHFTHKTNRHPQIFGKIDPVKLKREGKLHVAVKNLDDKPKNIRLRLILPRELSCTNADQQVALKPLEEKPFIFDLSNFSALPGAKHAVFALMEYEDEGSHLSLSIPGTVEIIEKRKLSKTESLWILSIPLALLLGFFGLMVYLKKRK